jgi:hypothetical protein
MADSWCGCEDAGEQRDDRHRGEGKLGVGRPDNNGRPVPGELPKHVDTERAVDIATSDEGDTGTTWTEFRQLGAFRDQVGQRSAGGPRRRCQVDQ